MEFKRALNAATQSFGTVPCGKVFPKGAGAPFGENLRPGTTFTFLLTDGKYMHTLSPAQNQSPVTSHQ